MEKVILSPPFSNLYPSIKGSTIIAGTYTLKKRKGLHRVLTTLKKVKGGWINNVGLRNPGIVKYNKKDSIISVALEEKNEWEEIKKILVSKKLKYNIIGIEFNVSCPNHKVSNINKQIIKEAKEEFENVIIKIPHLSSLKIIDQFCKTDANIIHVSNTKKIKYGGLSGKSLIEVNLININYIKKNYNKKVIAGGGIYSIKDAIRYKKAGADYFSLSTSLINPLRTVSLIRKLQYL